MTEDAKVFNEQEIKEMITCLDGMYSGEADGYADQLELLVGDMSPYSDGDELTDDDANLIDTVNNFIDNY